MQDLLALMIALLLGMFPTSLFVVRLWTGIDLRTYGVHQASWQQVLHWGKLEGGIMTLLLNLCKGFLAPFLAFYLTTNPLIIITAAWLVLAGNLIPWRGFRERSLVATTMGTVLLLAPPTISYLAAIWLIILLVSRRAWLATLCLSLLWPLVWSNQQYPPILMLFAVASSLLLAFNSLPHWRLTYPRNLPAA